MNLALRQPSMRRLEYWLDHKPAKFERYLAAHPEVAERFELENPFAALSASAHEAIAAAVAAPVDLAVRLRERLRDERHETTAAAVAIDLAGLGPATLRLLAGPIIEPEEPR